MAGLLGHVGGFGDETNGKDGIWAVLGAFPSPLPPLNPPLGHF